MERQIETWIKRVALLDETAQAQARQRQDRLAKPPGSLGRLEDLSIRAAGITGRLENRFDRKTLLVFCADNGVTAEGVASAPPLVTRIQTINLARGKTGAAVLARHFGVAVQVVDVGVDGPVEGPGVWHCKIRNGTGNIAKGPAMRREQAVRAILTGAQAAQRCVQDGAQVLGVGEMGIGNTTTSAAVLCALTGTPPEQAVGYGGGLTPAGYRRKVQVVQTALLANRPDGSDPVGTVAQVGGLDIAAMAGAFLGAAAQRIPAVIDGLISAVAALCAVRLCPAVGGYLIPSHASTEPGYAIAMAQLGLEPLLSLNMRLGEGSGCPLAMALLNAACAALSDMATFEQAGIDDGYLDPVRASMKEGAR